MITQEENDLLTQTGRGTPCGELMRRYWQPAALSEELGSDKPLPVQLFGEELILFRDGEGSPALIGRYCAHQGIDMAYGGEVEKDGIRCLYHGWLFDACGKVVVRGSWVEGGEKRMEVGSRHIHVLKPAALSLPIWDRGIRLRCRPMSFSSVPAENRAVTKIFLNCNYLQANEGNIDPVHLSFLHRNLQDSERDKASVPGSSASPNTLVGYGSDPDYRGRYHRLRFENPTTRKADRDKQYLRVTNFIYPNLAAFNGSTTGEGFSAHWHVPIDDRSHWKYAFLFSRERR